jgi:hypothetical protein
MSFINESFNIGKKNMIVGNGKEDFDISSINGYEVKINGIVPGAGGGGGVPPVGDISFIGNLYCNDQPGVGSKGIITAEKKINSGLGGVESTGLIKTGAAGDIHSGKDLVFDGQDIYKEYPGVVPPIARKTYKDYRGLIGTADNNTFTGINKFRNNAVSIQALNDAVPAVFVDKISLNTDGNIQCNEINNNTLIKSNSIICENGPASSQKVMARQYHFRPNSLETTGWVFSQKEPDNPAAPEDNYLMLQNTQATGSLNLVKSSFDPQNPTPFDIILDPQNGQVKTTTSFDAPKVNFRKNATDNWSIYQPPSGDANENKLRIQNYQDNAGGVQILDNSNNVWVEFTNLFTTFNKPTFINNVLTMVGNAVINNSYSLLFGSYSFRPQQFYKDITAFSFNNSAIGPTNLIFSTNDTDWVNKNTGATSQSLNLGVEANKGAYKLTFRQINAGTLGQINDMRIMSDIVLTLVNDGAPQITLPSPSSYAFEAYDGDAPEITQTPGFLVWNFYATFPQVSGNETSNVRITLTQMPYFA